MEVWSDVMKQLHKRSRGSMRSRWIMERKLRRCSFPSTGEHNPQPWDATVSEYIGIDLHKAKSFVTRFNRRGRVPEEVEPVYTSTELQEYRARQYSGLTLNPWRTSECVRPKEGVITCLEM